MSNSQTLTIPSTLLPTDGRFGSGPSRVRPEQMAALDRAGRTVMGTSHRQPAVKNLVGRIRRGLTDLFDAPDGYEVVLGNGGATAFWDTAVSSLIRTRSQHVTIGEFSQKFADAAAAAPHLQDPSVISSAPGTLALPTGEADVDAYAYAHNETSTGVMSPIIRPHSATDDQLVLVDATSGAGGLSVDIEQTDVYYFSPQKSFAADGGLWFALCSPAAISRAEEIAATDRWIPQFLSFTTALSNSRKDQTLNTPATATLLLMAEQVDWMNKNGGLDFTTARTAETSGLLHQWVERRDELTLFVTEPSARSQVVTTIDLDSAIDAAEVTRIARANGIIDIEPYRKLGRNQLRIATFPAVDPSDVQALIASLDWVLDQLS
ncbi:phosphoserine transaminase [Helcobacillus massiliensis]|uniref:phosphoserine transaminase n=1 Tax=Helcobacillus TaxID=1161125 RepID=UPI001EF4D9B8|nr:MULTISPECIES: phosphoserine transaminase [Helcobacillus]MCG7427629.1 phosphoserine transaminase [Helcobacillus sp. ACRRO]MCT1558718.1 phosphoserine transaminase [Helcobacillus massiliensis]MCT2037437.1 phosphoserine transaminase [Helcobacillus massiliensis]MCT2332957.1 phosphoserine transaminase [Helcobacillus massiliensis]MDK7743116.1 phosphoserine transaminase [Helcobacillus massiliensis]